MTTALRKVKDQERKDRTRALLMDAASRVFVDRGYHPTLISDIVAEAGVGQGTFYRFFPNKRSIFEALFEEFADSLLGQFQEFSANPPSNLEEYREASRKSLAEVARVLMAHREMAQLFMRQAPVIDRDFEARFADTLDLFASLARGYLEHAISLGFARSCDTSVVSQCLVGIARHLVSTLLSGSTDEEDTRRVLGEVIDFAFSGFGPV
jgi:AcrR family transcriptional regulator